MNKKTITLSLATFMLVGATSCVKNCDAPILPQSKIQVENSYRILRAYPADEIPSTGLVDLADVTEIADNVFAEAKSLKQITGLKLQKIGANAFKGSSLKTLILDKTVPTAADDAFAGTSEDKDLKVDASSASLFYAFARKHSFKTINGQALPQVVIKGGVLTSYPDYLLVENITLDNTVTSIAASVFADKTLIKEVHAASVNKIEAGAFKGATSLMKVELGENVPTATDDAFEGTPKDKDLVVPETAVAAYKEFATKHDFKTINGKDVYPIPAGVTIEGTELKKVSSDVTRETLELPPYVTKIAYGALQNRPSIKNIIGSGVVEIAENAFKNMTKLISADFPKLKKIERNAFNGCQSLKTLKAPMLEEVGIGALRGATALTEVNYPLLKVVPQDAFRAGYEGKLEKIVLPSVTAIEANAFGYHNNIKTIELGATAPKVDPQAFANKVNGTPKLIVPASAVSAYGGAGNKWMTFFTIEAKQ